MSAGFELRGYDPDPGAMERIVAAGATAAESPAMVAEMADVVFSMVPNDNVLLDIVSGPDGIARTIRPGSVLVDLSTVSPEASARVAEVMSGTGADYLRCPVSGSTSNAESGFPDVAGFGTRRCRQGLVRNTIRLRREPALFRRGRRGPHRQADDQHDGWRHAGPDRRSC